MNGGNKMNSKRNYFIWLPRSRMRVWFVTRVCVSSSSSSVALDLMLLYFYFILLFTTFFHALANDSTKFYRKHMHTYAFFIFYLPSTVNCLIQIYLCRYLNRLRYHRSPTLILSHSQWWFVECGWTTKTKTKTSEFELMYFFAYIEPHWNVCVRYFATYYIQYCSFLPIANIFSVYVKFHIFKWDIWLIAM